MGVPMPAHLRAWGSGDQRCSWVRYGQPDLRCWRVKSATSPRRSRRTRDTVWEWAWFSPRRPWLPKPRTSSGFMQDLVLTVPDDGRAYAW